MQHNQSKIINLKKVAWEIAFSPTEDRIAYFGGRDISVLDLGANRPLFAVHPIANPSQVDFSPDGECLAVKGTSGRTIVLDAETGRLLSDFRNQKEGEGERVFFSTCGRFVVSVSWDGLFSVREWRTTKLVFSRVHTDFQIRHLSLTADRRSFVYSLNCTPPPESAQAPWTVVLQRWPADAHEPCELLKQRSAIQGSQVSPSGRFLSIAHGTPPETLEVHDLKRSVVIANHRWSFGGISGCQIGWSSDEQFLIASGYGRDGEGACRVLEMPTLALKWEFSMEYPSFFQFSRSGRYLALGSAHRGIVLPTACLSEFAESRRKQT